MKYRHLGKAGIQVSELSFAPGCNGTTWLRGMAKNKEVRLSDRYWPKAAAQDPLRSPI